MLVFVLVLVLVPILTAPPSAIQPPGALCYNVNGLGSLVTGLSPLASRLLVWGSLFAGSVFFVAGGLIESHHNHVLKDSTRLSLKFLCFGNLGGSLSFLFASVTGFFMREDQFEWWVNFPQVRVFSSVSPFNQF